MFECMNDLSPFHIIKIFIGKRLTHNHRDHSRLLQTTFDSKRYSYRTLLKVWNWFPPCVEMFIIATSWWARWRLKSPASRLFTQPFIQAQIKENIKAQRHWPLCGEFWPVNLPHKGPVTQKMFPFDDVIMSLRITCSEFWWVLKYTHSIIIELNFQKVDNLLIDKILYQYIFIHIIIARLQ